MAKDVVCGMEVDPKTAPARTEYEGQTYYFCAPGCKVAFDKDPEKYLQPRAKRPTWAITAAVAEDKYEFTNLRIYGSGPHRGDFQRR